MENKYICEKCKSVVWASDLESVKGDWCGDHYMGDEYACPECGSFELYEAVECPCCGEYVLKDEAYGGNCQNCVDKAATPENLIEWCDIEEETERVEINYAVYSMIKALKVDINELLKEVVNESVYKYKLKKSCESMVEFEIDTECFMKWWKDRG